jgi:hypothetical protein
VRIEVTLMRALVGAATVVLTTACASMNPPPGGPEDSAAPVVVSASPDSGAVNARPPGAVFRFDEPVSDRVEEAELERLILLSPADGAPRISWRREAVVVRPRRDWKPNTTYTVTLQPGVADLRGNRSKTARTILFSTGPTIATQVFAGHVFDWQGERVAPNALVEAVGRDSSVYLATTDSSGAFVVGPLPGGEYRLRAFLDANRNRGLDRGEAWDTVTTVAATQRTVVDLYAALRDSIPPRIASASALDSLHVVIEFDRAVDPTQPIDTSNVGLKRADSSQVRILALHRRRDFDRIQQETRRQTDTVNRPDTVNRADTAAIARARRDSIAAAAARPQLPARPTAPRPTRPPPPIAFVITVAEPLRPGTTYRLRATGVRGITGYSRDSDRTFSVAASDSARPPATPDSVRRPTPFRRP